jgi:putative acetyltransferase
MHIRPEQATDIPNIRELNQAAFDSSTEADLVDALRVAASDVVSLVAVKDGGIVGHIMFSPVRIAGAEEVRAMGLAPMAVAPAHQRAGIGSALVRAGLEECRRLAVETVFVVGHAAYYPRFGFVRASTAGIACEFEVPDDSFMVIELAAGALSRRAATVYFHPAFKGA